MNYSYTNELTEKLRNKNIPADVRHNFDRAFDIEYTHHSTAIEGNTLTLIETKTLLEDGISIGGKRLREIYEVVNHNKAFGFIKQKVSAGISLDENIVKDIHAIITENIIVRGVYRNCDVVITGASHTPPTPNEMYSQIKYFYSRLNRTDLNPIELAAWIHAEFVRIHPFVDGNGRTARLIMNYTLMSSGFLPVNICTADRLKYYEYLDEYASENKIEPLADFIADIEVRELEKYLAIEF